MIITPLKDRVEETTWTIVALGSTSIFFSRFVASSLT